jgi:cell division protein FtsQ
MTPRLRPRPDERSRASSERRFAQRARRRRLLSLRPVLIGLGVVTLVALAGWLVFRSSLLAVHSVSVRGESRLTPAAVSRAARVPQGKPLALLDTAAVRRRVEAMPPVRSAAVERVWPQGVRITVVERTPVAAVKRPGKPLALVDDTGVLFADVAAAPPDMAVLSLANPGPSDPATKAALSVVAALPVSLRPSVITISAPTPAAVTLSLSQGITVVWGDGSNSARKAQTLTALLKAQAHPPVVLDRHGKPLPPPAKATWYDVSSPEVATVRQSTPPRPGAATTPPVSATSAAPPSAAPTTTAPTSAPTSTAVPTTGTAPAPGATTTSAATAVVTTTAGAGARTSPAVTP